MRKIPRNIWFIFRRLNKIVLIGISIFSGFFYFFISPVYAVSLLLGGVFSGVIFLFFVSAQADILFNKNKTLFFVYFIFRLGLYSIPLMIGLVYKKYFNFYVILISLFIYQIFYIWFEFSRSYKKIKGKY